MRRIPIHWDDLESAFERNAPDIESFLDATTGHVVSIVGGDPEAPMLKEQVAGQIQNYLRVEPASSREQYRWMERFVGSVVDEALRERLLISIDGKGAFRRFKDVLVAYPAERERWFTYRADLLHWHMHNWLNERQIEPAAAPPWGEVSAPADLAEAPVRAVHHGAEPPGEALRRQARDLIEGMAAIELPSAIAFLEFLREKGTRGLQAAAAARTPNGPTSGAGAATPAPGSPQDDEDDEDDERPRRPTRHLGTVEKLSS